MKPPPLKQRRLEIDEPPHTRDTRSKISSGTSDDCTICNKKQFVKGRIVPLILITLRDKTTKAHRAEEKLKKFADLHLNNNESPYTDGAKRIKLQLTVKALFAADACYHRSCYQNFMSPK